MRHGALRFGERAVSDPHGIATRDKAEASARFQATVEFHLTMKRYGRIMLVLCALTLALSLWGILRDVRQDTRLERLTSRVDALEASRGK